MTSDQQHHQDGLRGLPAFEGDVATYPAYRLRCKGVYAETEDAKRHLIAPAIWRRLQGEAWETVKDIDPETLRAENGFHTLIGILDEAFQWEPVSHLQLTIDEHLFMEGREMGESITALLARNRAAMKRFTSLIQKYYDEQAAEKDREQT